MEYTLEEVMDRLEKEMPSLSPTAGKVQKLGNDINCSPGALTKVIKLDPVLTARVMKLVNSSYCSTANKVVSLEKAIIMLGINTIKNLALSVAVLEQFQARGDECFSMQDYWVHCLATGVVAKQLAIKQGVDRKIVEDFFLAGMIHDLGLLVEKQFYPEEMEEVVEQARNMGLIASEDYALCNLNHCLVGKALGERWGLTNDLIAVLLRHHDPHHEGRHARLVRTVYLANMLCKIHDIGLALDRGRGEIDPHVYTSLRLPPEVGEEVMLDIDEEIKKALEFLHV